MLKANGEVTNKGKEKSFIYKTKGYVQDNKEITKGKDEKKRKIKIK